MNNIILIGMPGVGKSCIGVVLAKALGMSFIDSDIVIQEQTGRTLSEIIHQVGRGGFLRLEDEINAGIRAENSVIATGGSAVYGAEAMRHLAEIGTIVYLDAPERELEDRLGDLDARGVVRNGKETVREIFEERLYLYMHYAQITIQLTGKTLRTAVDDTVRLLKTQGLVLPASEEPGTAKA